MKLSVDGAETEPRNKKFKRKHLIEKFCHQLISLRADKTQQAFANEIGINRSTLSLLETGKQLPTLEILNKICDFSNMIIDEFFIENEKDGLGSNLEYILEKSKRWLDLFNG